ncbi:Acyltransferase domain protein [Synechococcus sp. PCC 7335]|uniref:lysophospholipid acyltransferase family protein n=1 Tax=Synechococcus sp. (strain ATCC 29403 / PCC 7335) TaxID=91464 RepID=UPI00017EE0D6|nr:1-acyl-sn-glycerol-3-phosphate acyltransferase [Synechococcus sp. PCC 7335]EDX86307.1 Acyltransferase domain protein [Synechococcus sp. PCC 7335]
MPKTRRAAPPLTFIPPVYSPWIMRLVHWALPFLMRFRIRPWLPAGITRIEVKNVERLVKLYAELEAGESRFLMAVRHVEVDDPLTGLYLCSRAVKRAAKAQGIPLQQPIHTHFLYERGMTLWAGKGLGWMLSRIGGVPIRRGRRPDWVSLKAARKLMIQGTMPMVVAPEGATNGHSERLGPLEPGVAQLGFWCAEDLAREQRLEQVFILPIGIRYRYEQAYWPQLQHLLNRLEKESGLSRQENLAPSADKDCYLRILRLGIYLLTTMESFYDRFYPRTFKSQAEPQTPQTIDVEKLSYLELADIDPATYSDRLRSLLDGALKVAEQFFNLSNKGTVVDRCRRIEEASWQVIYREDLPALSTLSPFERGLADWAAQEASLRELHMRVVESFVAVDGEYLKEKPSFERCAEMAMLMFDLVTKIGDRSPADRSGAGRPRLGKRRVTMVVQPPISVSDRLADYQQNRRAGRAAVASLTEEIRLSLEATIEQSDG